MDWSLRSENVLHFVFYYALGTDFILYYLLPVLLVARRHLIAIWHYKY